MCDVADDEIIRLMNSDSVEIFECEKRFMRCLSFGCLSLRLRTIPQKGKYALFKSFSTFGVFKVKGNMLCMFTTHFQFHNYRNRQYFGSYKVTYFYFLNDADVINAFPFHDFTNSSSSHATAFVASVWESPINHFEAVVMNSIYICFAVFNVIHSRRLIISHSQVYLRYLDGIPPAADNHSYCREIDIVVVLQMLGNRSTTLSQFSFHPKH